MSAPTPVTTRKVRVRQVDGTYKRTEIAMTRDEYRALAEARGETVGFSGHAY